jgi:hypothetical protein
MYDFIPNLEFFVDTAKRACQGRIEKSQTREPTLIVRSKHSRAYFTSFNGILIPLALMESVLISVSSSARKNLAISFFSKVLGF